MQDAFHAELRRRVEGIIGEHTFVVTTGMPASIEDYRRHVGYIAAMRDVLELCNEIQQRLYANPLKREA
jgi:replicative DNA helicase